MNTKYDSHFKQEAINLALTSDQTYQQTADDLGIKYKTLCNWIQQTMNKPTSQSIKSNKKPENVKIKPSYGAFR